MFHPLKNHTNNQDVVSLAGSDEKLSEAQYATIKLDILLKGCNRLECGEELRHLIGPTAKHTDRAEI